MVGRLAAGRGEGAVAFGQPIINFTAPTHALLCDTATSPVRYQAKFKFEGKLLLVKMSH